MANRWCNLFLPLLALAVLLLELTAQAQDRGSLFSSGALLRASRGALGSAVGTDALNSSLSRAVSDQLQLDTFDDLAMMSEKQQAYSSQYRAFANLYLSDHHSSALYDEELVNDLAQRVAAYQSAVTLGDYLNRSPIGNVYRRVLDSLAEYREHVTLRVGRKADGSVGVIERRNRKHQLLEFKLNANPTRGVEPRLRVIDDFVLKYDTIADATLIEYNISF